MKQSQVKSLKTKEFNSPEKLCIFFHGYGTNGLDFQEAVQYFIPKSVKNTLFLFPDAPFKCEIGEGFQWFSLKNISYNGIREGLDLSAPIVANFIQDVSKFYNPKQIILMGFSQGAIMCFEMLYHFNISKIVAFSGLFAPSQKQQLKATTTKTLILHSEDDDVVPFSNATNAVENLKKLNMKARLIAFKNIGHSISIDGWNEAFSFFKE